MIARGKNQKQSLLDQNNKIIRSVHIGIWPASLGQQRGYVIHWNIETRRLKIKAQILPRKTRARPRTF